MTDNNSNQILIMNLYPKILYHLLSGPCLDIAPDKFSRMQGH